MNTIANIEAHQKFYLESITNPESFRGSISQNFVWKKEWSKFPSGKIMRRILSKTAKIDAGDTTTLLDRTLADEILEGVF
jgi:hypothetical protein